MSLHHGTIRTTTHIPPATSDNVIEDTYKGKSLDVKGHRTDVDDGDIVAIQQVCERFMRTNGNRSM